MEHAPPASLSARRLTGRWSGPAEPAAQRQVVRPLPRRSRDAETMLGRIVAVVLEPAFDAKRLASLVAQRPVWLLATPANQETATSLRAAGGADLLTTFKPG